MRLDHVSYAVREAEIAETVQRIGSELGGSFIDGGRHPRFGTRNFVFALGNGTYVEVVCALDHPATEQAPFGRAVRARADAGGGWMGWAIAATDLSPIEARLGRTAVPGHRVRPDGVDLTWRQIGVLDLIAEPSIPYFIKWDEGVEHPAAAGNGDIAIKCLQLGGDSNPVYSALGGSDIVDEVCLCWIDNEDAGLVAVTFSTPHGEVRID